VQGLVPAILVREIPIRRSPLRGTRWLPGMFLALVGSVAALTTLGRLAGRGIRGFPCDVWYGGCGNCPSALRLTVMSPQQPDATFLRTPASIGDDLFCNEKAAARPQFGVSVSDLLQALFENDSAAQAALPRAQKQDTDTG